MLIVAIQYMYFYVLRIYFTENGAVVTLQLISYSRQHNIYYY